MSRQNSSSSPDFQHYLKRQQAAGKKMFAVLVDPDDTDPGQTGRLGQKALEAGVDFFLVGGSLVVSDSLEETVRTLRDASGLPIILFPGSIRQITPAADGILLLSLLSGRNPEMLIGQHVQAAPALKRSGLEILPTGYLLVDGGTETTVSYISGTKPIPADKASIAAATALAGEQLGLGITYLDAGSGAHQAVPASMIEAVRNEVEQPIIVGGGIRTPEQAEAAARAGADVVVVGNALEENPEAVRELSIAVHAVSSPVEKLH
jgi:putative glycerol-1-phosphate prenyltransferase